jgi:hypothetical protein
MPQVHILNQMSPVHIIIYSSKVHINIIFPSMLRYLGLPSDLFLLLIFRLKFCIYFSSLPQVLHTLLSLLLPFNITYPHNCVILLINPCSDTLVSSFRILSFFGKKKVSLCDHQYAYVHIPPSNLWSNWPIFTKCCMNFSPVEDTTGFSSISSHN